MIVVDDASTDETPDRLSDIDDPRLRVLRHERNRGVSPARDWAIEVARGDWIAFLDSDDLWAPQKLRRQLDVAERTGASFVYSAAVVLDEQKGTVRPDEPVPPPGELRARLLIGNAIPGGCSSVIARKDAVLRAGPFDPRLMMLSDWDFWLRLADVAEGAACDEILVGYRRHARNLTVTDLEHIESELEYFGAKHARDRGMKFDRVAYARWLAGEARGPLHAARVYYRTGVAYRSAGNLIRAVGALVGAWNVSRWARDVRERRRGGVEPTQGPEWLRIDRQAAAVR